jgi:hypothetical protein
VKYQDFIDQVIDVAASINPDALQDAEAVVEPLIPIVWQDVAEKFAGDEQRRQLLKKTFVISVSNGAVTIDSSILTSSMDDSLLYDPANPNDRYAFQRNYSQMVQMGPELIGFYGLEFGDRLRVVAPNTAFDYATGPTQNFSLNIAAIPPVPTSATGVIAAPDEFISDIVDACAQKLQAITPSGQAVQ